MQVELTEELVLNPGAWPESLRQHRYYRVEYYTNESPYAVWEGRILLPKNVNAEDLEILLNNEVVRAND